MSPWRENLTIDYDFYTSKSGDYAFDGSAALTFTKPAGEGSGVMKVNYCFVASNSENANEYVAVQTGFARGGIIPPLASSSSRKGYNKRHS